MIAILVKIEQATKSRVARAATKAGLSQREFCRRAILQALGGGDLEIMVQQIHATVCGSVSSAAAPISQEAQDAVAALVGLGVGEQEAVQRVNQVTSAKGDLPAAHIIRECMSHAKG